MTKPKARQLTEGGLRSRLAEGGNLYVRLPNGKLCFVRMKNPQSYSALLDYIQSQERAGSQFFIERPDGLLERVQTTLTPRQTAYRAVTTLTEKPRPRRLSNVLVGMGSALEALPPSSTRTFFRAKDFRGSAADADAIRADWGRVGEDIRLAMDTVEAQRSKHE